MGSRITVKNRSKELNGLALLFLAFLVGSGLYTAQVFSTPMLWLGVVSVAICISGFLYAIVREELIIEIDGLGIYDRGLGVGKINWEDVESIQLLQTHQSRYLCFSLKNPDTYVQRLQGQQKSSALFHQQIGLNRFNVDISQVDINPIDLKHLVDKQIAKHSLGPNQ